METTRRRFVQAIAALAGGVAAIAQLPQVTKERVESERKKCTDVPAPRVQGATTRIEAFVRSRGIKPSRLAREAGYSRQYLLGVRRGQIRPTWRCMVEVTKACRRLTREDVRVRQLFG